MTTDPLRSYLSNLVKSSRGERIALGNRDTITEIYNGSFGRFSNGPKQKGMRRVSFAKGFAVGSLPVSDLNDRERLEPKRPLAGEWRIHSVLTQGHRFSELHGL